MQVNGREKIALKGWTENGPDYDVTYQTVDQATMGVVEEIVEHRTGSAQVKAHGAWKVVEIDDDLFLLMHGDSDYVISLPDHDPVHVRTMSDGGVVRLHGAGGIKVDGKPTHVSEAPQSPPEERAVPAQPKKSKSKSNKKHSKAK